MRAQNSHSLIGGFRLALYRMIKCARLNSEMFRSLREDTGATSQSLIVLAVAGMSFGLGFTASLGDELWRVLLIGAFGIIVAVVIGFVWLSLIYLVGTRLLKGVSGYWELARPVFFAASPGLVFLLMIPALAASSLISTAGIAWIAIANVFAIKNGLGIDYQRSLIAFIVVAFVLLILYGFLTTL